ncbi:DMT family transporter [Moritella sp. F3]|uniref:DMT family transporter n=1 Tax=Moritella sp. F3 TaxID=2718882 RepID=UPI0018E15376|nr:DMT family transporter [Moritella sp. F3]GIC75934.1 multidrug DMT transporter [Moritella sp. F1]GIC81473.1 multidrug DMT transporter [Moritella sp. F3]
MYFLLPLFTVIIWSGNSIVNILSANVIAPETISFYRWFIALITLTPFLIKPVWKKRHAIKPYLSKLAFLALLGMAINQSLAYFAAATTTATHMTLIFALVPLLSLMFSVPILGLTLTKKALFGAMISLTGLVYMLSHGKISNLLSEGINIGDTYMLIAACSYSLYGVLLKRWRLPFNNWIALYVQMVFAVIILLPVLTYHGQVSLTTESLPLVLYAAIPTSILATWLWMQSIQHLGADKSAMFMNLLPVFTAVMATFILDEQLSSYQFIGGALVLTGVAMTQFKSRKVVKKEVLI